MNQPSGRITRNSLVHALRDVSGKSLRPLAWSFLLSIAAQGVLFVGNFALARVLGKNTFGEWAALQSTVNTVSTIAQLSMAVTATKYVAQYRVLRPDRAGAVLALCGITTALTGLIASGGLFLGSAWMARVALGVPELELEVRFSVLTIFLGTISGYQIGALAGLGQFRALALLGMGNGTCALVLTIALGLRFGLPGAVAGQAIAQLVNWATHRTVLMGELRAAGIRMSWRQASTERRIFVHFTIPATLSGIAGMLGLWGATVAIVHSPSGYSAMAIFASASVLRGVVLFPPGVLNRVSTTVLSNMSEPEEHEAYRRTLRRSVLLSFASSGVAAIGIAVCSPWLMGIFGPAFREGYGVACVLAFAGVLEATTTAYSQDFVAKDRMWTNLGVFAARGILLVGGTVVFAARYGAVGAAIAVVAAQFVGMVVAAWGARDLPFPARGRATGGSVKDP